MTGSVFARRFVGPTIPLLMAALAALTVASLARTQGFRDGSSGLVDPSPMIQHAVLEATSARHGICLYSTGSDDDPPDDPDRVVLPRERIGEGRK